MTSLDGYIEAGELRLRIRHLTEHDLPSLLALFQGEGWVDLTYYLHELIQSYPDAFIGAFLNDTELVSHVLLMNLTDAVAFFGGFVTKDIYRRMGIGYHLFNKAISLSRGRKVVLESTWQMPQKYEKRGFVKEFNFYKVSGILRSWTESSSCGHQKPPWGTSYMIRPVKEDNIADVCMYDKSISGNNREPFLRKVLLNPNTIAYCAVSDRGDVLGLLAVRKVDLNRTSIFSFYASDYNIAEVLLRTVVSNPVVVGSALSLYIPEINPECMKLFQLCGLERDQSGQKVVRMSNKDFSENIPWQKVYSVCCVGYFNV